MDKSMFVSILFLLLWWLVWLLPTVSKRLPVRVIGYTILLPLLLYSVVVTMRDYYDLWYPYRIVKQDQPLYRGADATYAPCATVRQYATVREYEMHNGWCKIEYEGQRGWLPAVALER